MSQLKSDKSSIVPERPGWRASQLNMIERMQEVLIFEEETFVLLAFVLFVHPNKRFSIGGGAFWENHCVRPAWNICPSETRNKHLAFLSLHFPKNIFVFRFLRNFGFWSTAFYSNLYEKSDEWTMDMGNLLIFSAVSFLLNSAAGPPGVPVPRPRSTQTVWKENDQFNIR